MGLCMERFYEHDAWKEENGSSCRPNRRGGALLAVGTPEPTLTWHQEILTLLLPTSKGLNLSASTLTSLNGLVIDGGCCDG